MNETRKRKIESQIVKSIARSIVSGKLKDPRIGIVSVHRADISNDMAGVKVWITSFVEGREKRILVNALRSARGFFQSVIAKDLQLRLTPRILFLWDEKFIESLKVNELIDRSRPKDYSQENAPFITED
jgi:ribosome-binding factor A